VRIGGYTLFEILIVLFIISILTSVALITIGHNQNKRMEYFVAEFTQLVTLAEEQAMLQPATLGLTIDDAVMEFQRYQAPLAKEPRQWITLNDTVLGRHPIPEGIVVYFKDSDAAQSSSERSPRIVISMNGDITPFTLYVGKRGEKPQYKITGDADGSISQQWLSS
jgi:prepilin-type N-terminal cleavage/methylation domain-containing protein